jgi:4-hydroxy-tetrahydrodipicolinate synthase
MMSKISDPKSWAKHELKGHFVTMTTPFNPDLSVDYEGIRTNLAKSQEIPCVTGVYVNSIYNEPTALTLEERKRVVECSLAALKPGMISVVAIGGVPLADAIELAQHAQQCGASLLIFWPPIFGYRSREGVQSYFRAVMSSVSMPVSVYRSGLPEYGYLASIDEIRELCELPNFCAVKDASMSLTKYLDILDAVGDQVAVSCPLDEYWAVGRMLMPTKSPDFFLGSSRPLYCETPERPYLSDLRAAANKGDGRAVEKALGPILKISNGLHTKFLEAGGHNVALTKKTTELLGYVCGAVRPPLSLPDAQTMAPVRELFEEVGFKLA